MHHLVVSLREIDMLFEDLQFVPGVLVEADLTNPQDIRLLEEVGVDETVRAEISSLSESSEAQAKNSRPGKRRL